MNKPLPTQSRIVVIGGGAVGASIAYHLSRAGERDVVLLEKARLTEGATWHAAGLVGQFRSLPNLTRLMQDSVRLFKSLAGETGQETGWSPVGSLRVAASQDRWMEFQKAATAARSFGFEMALLSPDEAKQLYPLMAMDGVVGAAFIADDGHVDPYSLTQAYAKGIRANGGRIFEGVMVTGLTRKGRRITHVVTDQGTIEAEIVVNAAGLWARQVGWMAGVDLPAGVVQHQYMVTEKSDLIPDRLPTFRDPDGSYYAKPEPGALAIGGWERSTPPVDPVEGFPWKNAHHLFDSDFDRFAEVFEPAAERIPVLNDLGMRSLVNGPIPISPDGEPVMGLAPGLENFYVACAFTSGIAASGGAGKAMANWILEGDPGLDLWAFDVRRFGPLHASPRYLHDRAVESYSRYYDIHWPGEERKAARGARRSPLYQTLAAKGRGLRFEIRLGAPELVRAARQQPGTRLATPGRGRDSWRRAPRRPRGCGHHRHEFVHQVRDHRPARVRLPPAPGGGRCRQGAGRGGLYPALQCKWRHRGRCDDHPPCRKPVLAGHRIGAGRARRRLAAREPRPFRCGWG